MSYQELMEKYLNTQKENEEIHKKYDESQNKIKELEEEKIKKQKVE